nr:MAG TPA: hypothetical protein [Caudoviricetes sp.]
MVVPKNAPKQYPAQKPAVVSKSKFSISFSFLFVNKKADRKTRRRLIK